MMNERQKQELTKISRGGVRLHCPMAPYTTFHIGGEVDALCFVETLEELRQLVTYMIKEGISYLVVGRGSNLLIKNGGFEGVFLILRGELSTIRAIDDNDSMVMAGGGLWLSDLVSHCSQKGLGGLEFLAGIPGTVGGAVVMNAGAFEKEMANVIEQVQVLDPQGDLIKNRGSELSFSYRDFSLSDRSIVVSARIQCARESKEKVSMKVMEYLRKRKAAQPLEYPSAGSVFKNPPNDHAGRLIEEAGLKGKKVGGAMISSKHANFIVNMGGAKADDVLALMDLAREKVRKDTGIELEPEIRVIGGRQ